MPFIFIVSLLYHFVHILSNPIYGLFLEEIIELCHKKGENTEDYSNGVQKKNMFRQKSA